MKSSTVDLVLVVDASSSMGPCFAQLREHLKELIYPLQQAQFKVRFGLLAYAAAKRNGKVMYHHSFLCGNGHETLQKLYAPEAAESGFFSTDPSSIAQVLDGVVAQGNEDTYVALDIAADFPFGPADSTRRVVALFTDEPLEAGVQEAAPKAKLPELIKKFQDRKIQFFASAPFSESLEDLAAMDSAQIEAITGGDGLQSVDFRKLLAQMGKSISVSTLQAGVEPRFVKALFGQNLWSPEQSVSESNRQVVLSVGESTVLDPSKPLKKINVRLSWSASVDLDLHAFYRTRNGVESEIYYGDKTGPGIKLDFDAGVGDTGGQNEENIVVSAPEKFEEILFATKIFIKGGCYADYGAMIHLTTNNGDNVCVPLTSEERADWCVIAKLTSDANGTSITNLNAVTIETPSVTDF